MKTENGLYEIGIEREALIERLLEKNPRLDVTSLKSGLLDESLVRFLTIMPQEIEEREPVGETYEAVFIDTETTGLDHEKDELTQFGYVRFQFDDEYNITKVTKIGSHYNEPSCEIPERVTLLTGLTAEFLKGHELKKEHFDDAFEGVEFVIAHNAKFDRGFVEKYYDNKKMIWACTNVDLGLRDKLMIPSNSLGVLMAYLYGYFFGHHNALDDCWAGVHLCNLFLKELIEAVYKPEFRVYAYSSVFESKDFLKLRGYKWDNNGKVWWKGGFSDEDADSEIEEIKPIAKGDPRKQSVEIQGRHL